MSAQRTKMSSTDRDIPQNNNGWGVTNLLRTVAGVTSAAMLGSYMITNSYGNGSNGEAFPSLLPDPSVYGFDDRFKKQIFAATESHSSADGKGNGGTVSAKQEKKTENDVEHPLLCQQSFSRSDLDHMRRRYEKSIVQACQTKDFQRIRCLTSILEVMHEIEMLSEQMKQNLDSGRHKQNQTVSAYLNDLHSKLYQALEKEKEQQQHLQKSTIADESSSRSRNHREDKTSRKRHPCVIENGGSARKKTQGRTDSASCKRRSHQLSSQNVGVLQSCSVQTSIGKGIEESTCDNMWIPRKMRKDCEADAYPTSLGVSRGGVASGPSPSLKNDATTLQDESDAYSSTNAEFSDEESENVGWNSDNEGPDGGNDNEDKKNASPPVSLKPGSVSKNHWYYSTLENDTVGSISKKLGCDIGDILSLQYNLENVNDFDLVTKNRSLRFKAKTILQIPKRRCWKLRLDELQERFIDGE